jgi:hypothetical protein
MSAGKGMSSAQFHLVIGLPSLVAQVAIPLNAAYFVSWNGRLSRVEGIVPR